MQGLLTLDPKHRMTAGAQDDGSLLQGDFAEINDYPLFVAPCININTFYRQSFNRSIVGSWVLGLGLGSWVFGLRSSVFAHQLANNAARANSTPGATYSYVAPDAAGGGGGGGGGGAGQLAVEFRAGPIQST